MWCGVKWCKSCITIQTSNIKIKKWHPIVLDGKLFYVSDICIFSLISCGSHSVILWKDKGHIMSWIYASCLCVWIPWLWGTHLLGPSESCALNLIGCWHKTHWAQATPIWTMHLWDAWDNYWRWCIYEMHEDFPFYLFIVFLITIFPFTGSFISLICHGCCCWCHVCVFKLFLI